MTIDKLVKTLLESGARSATFYETPKRIVRATRMVSNYKGRKSFDKQTHTITLTIGRPNYLEADFINKALKAGEPFPVKKAQLRFLKA